MAIMAKKKKPSGAPEPDGSTADRHASTFMVRLREVFRVQLRKLREKNRRTFTAEIEIALEEYLAKQGLWPPEEDSST